MGDIDFFAFHNRMRRWPWQEKLALGLTGLYLSHRFPSLPIHLALFVCNSLILCGWAGVPWRLYLRFCSFPAGFVLVGAFTTLWPMQGHFQPDLLPSAVLLISRTLASLSAMYVLALTTPVAEWLSVLCQFGFPRPLAEIGLLMYQLIGVAVSSLRRIQVARACRCGGGSFTLRLSTLSLAMAAFQLQLESRVRAWEMSLRLRGGMAGLCRPPAQQPCHIWLWLALGTLWWLSR